MSAIDTETSKYDSLLATGERVLLVRQRHWLTFLEAGRWFVLALVIGLVSGALDAGVPNDGVAGPISTLLNYAFWIALAVGLIGLVWYFLVWRVERYLVTTRRVIEAGGVINKYTHDTSLQAITDMNVGHPWLGRIVGYGEIDLLTAAEAGTSKIRFLPDADGFKKALLDAKQEHELEVGGGRAMQEAVAARLSRSARGRRRHVRRGAGHRAQPPGGHEGSRADHPGGVRPEEARASRPAPISDARGGAAGTSRTRARAGHRGAGAGVAHREDAPVGGCQARGRRAARRARAGRAEPASLGRRDLRDGRPGQRGRRRDHRGRPRLPALHLAAAARARHRRGPRHRRGRQLGVSRGGRQVARRGGPGLELDRQRRRQPEPLVRASDRRSGAGLGDAERAPGADRGAQVGLDRRSEPCAEAEARRVAEAPRPAASASESCRQPPVRPGPGRPAPVCS